MRAGTGGWRGERRGGGRAGRHRGEEEESRRGGRGKGGVSGGEGKGRAGRPPAAAAAAAAVWRARRRRQQHGRGEGDDATGDSNRSGLPEASTAGRRPQEGEGGVHLPQQQQQQHQQRLGRGEEGRASW